MNIPTKITVSRIVLVVLMLIGFWVLDFIPGFVSPMVGDSQISLVYLVACVIFIIASITDKIDGDLARKWNQVTDLGKFLDPIADKLLVDCLLIFLIFPHYASSSSTQILIPTYCVIIMIARDLVVDALRSIAAAKGKVLAANWFGKIKTACQMVAIPVVLLNGWPFSYFDASWGAWRIGLVLIYISTLASLLAGTIYVIQNFHILKEDKA